jgi:hypothetical protein
MALFRSAFGRVFAFRPSFSLEEVCRKTLQVGELGRVVHDLPLDGNGC